MKTEHDVVVVGAGPVGLLLSIELARRGIDVALIERLHEPTIGSKGKGIQPRSQEILQQLDVLPELQAQGGRYPSFRLYLPDGVREEPYALPIEPTPDRPYPNILLVPQWITEQVLRKRVAALRVPLHLGCEVTGLEQDERAVSLTVRDGERNHTLRARYVIGSDGARSVIRHETAIGFSGQTLPRRAIFADVRVANLSTEFWHRWPDAPGGQVSLCPLLGTNLFQMAAEVAPEGDVDISPAALEQLLRARLGNTGMEVKEVTWTSLFRVNLRLADRYRVGRVFLAGDSAHVHPPTGGQGLNTGIGDAFNLGWKLAAVLRGASPALLDTYEAERRSIAQDMLELSGALLGAWQARRKTERGKLTDQLDLNYRDSELSRELGPGSTHALHAGDRAPDARLSLANGRTTRLFELLKHPGFTLLGYGAPADRRDPIPELAGLSRVTIGPREGAGSFDARDSDGDFARFYGLESGSFVLIRPDGYIAILAAASELGGLRSYLTKWLQNARARGTEEEIMI